MNRNAMTEWSKYQSLRERFPVEAEKGRLVAAHMMANDAEARRRVENEFGLEFCRAMYPEVYENGVRSTFGKLLDTARNLIPW